MSEPLKVWLDREGRLLRLRLARPKANIVDAEMIGALAAAFDKHRTDDGLTGALLDAEGPNFSFGASVEEHLPQNCAAMLAALHALIVKMLEWPAPILVAVQGQCLGGGLEVALAASRIIAAPDARFGQPEIKLAVFAPAASCLLPYRVNQQAAEDLLFSGRALKASEAKSLGLVAEIADDPAAAALDYFDAQLADKSGAALGYALRAARGAMLPEVKRRLAEV
ncbi:MAG: cyclohexa-1,5-dienecarbonyl-CoA hydratase, partial [bacterium]